MSDDELEKLAQEMQNISPSETARERGMAAAMAAFDMEFAREAAADSVAENVKEKTSNTSQGLADQPRPTGQNTHEWHVLTKGRDMMARFRNFNFTPKAVMMGGSCMAALLVSMVFFDAGQFGTAPIAADSAKQEVVEPLAVEPHITAPVIEPSINLKDGDISVAPIDATPPQAETINSRPPHTNLKNPGINSISDLLDKTNDDNAKTKTADTKINTPSNTVVVERRVLKTPARTMERAVPAVTKMETRRRVKTPASTVERVVPAITKEVTRQIEENGETKTVTETVIVQPQSVEYVSVPAEYETYSEAVAVQEASTELVTIPATFDTVRETIEIQADGTQKVISSEIVPPAKAPKPQDSIPNFDVPLAAKKSTVQPRPTPLSNPRRQSNTLMSSGNNAALDAPLPEKIAGLTLEVVPSEPVSGGRINTNNNQQFTVFNGVSTEVLQSTETIVEQTGEILARVMIPAKYKTVTKQVLVSPAKSEKVIIPAVTKDITVKLANEDGSFREVVKQVVIEEERIDYIITPAKYETRTERVLIAPAQDEWKPGSQAIYAKPAPRKYVLRDDDGNVVREFENRDAFEIYKSNLTTSVEDTPVSTFSIDVDTASYSFMRASLNRGQLPPRASIRLEEMINYFPYDYDAPRSADEPFKANISVTPTPWNADTKLMHIGIKGYVPPKAERPRSNLVFLIDTSGSMNSPNKLPLLINSFKLLLNTLGDDDTVSIVTYAGRAGTVLEPTLASDKHKIKDALTRLRAGGSTAGAAGLELAYQKAQESFDDEANNRVILATDGDFNVGFSSHDEMKEFITKKRETGIFLSVLGFGQGNYNDQLMQALAQNGNGVAAYIDNLNEASKVLANEAGSSLTTIAKDVKIQVEFNPETISEYRLIGYETRALKRQDFNNDKVDAGEIGAGHTVTAIYELTPVGSPAKVFDPLRYVDSKLKTTGSNEFAFVKIRHKLPDADTSTLQTFPVSPKQERSLKRTSDDTRFAAAVAAFGQKLRSSPHLAEYSYDELIAMANSAKGDDENGYRAEFIQLVRLAKELDD